jgi:PAS domain S-box-containing protein
MSGPIDKPTNRRPYNLPSHSADTVVWIPKKQETASAPSQNVSSLGTSRYQLAEEIARGGMSTVYRARDLHLSRDVAIKILRLDPVAYPEAIRSYANEAHIMSYLSHPGVTPVYDCGKCDDERPYQVMKLITGNTLLEMIQGVVPFRTSQLLSVFGDICHTMAFAHSRNVMHLDLKPANVMVGEFGEVQVMDWGLARFLGSAPDSLGDWVYASSEDLGKRGVNGTLEYMSPEQARCEPLDTRADVFSLGAILCEILLGHAPYQGESIRQVYARARRASLDSTFEGLEEVDTDRALVRLVKRCLAPRREDRPASAIEVAQEMAIYHDTALHRVENDMNRFFELSLDLFCIADFNGYFRRINANFNRVLGHPESELLSKPFLEFIHTDDRDETVRVMHVLSEGQPVVRFRNRYHTLSRDLVTLEWTAKSVASDRLIFAVARDVTARP